MPDTFPDQVHLSDWHPVASSAQLTPGALLATQLLDTALVLWRAADGALNAWQDRCPHRGMKLSMGTLIDNRVRCAYHGWAFGSGGKCQHIPALPELRDENLKARVAGFAVQEKYGLVWVCLGQPGGPVPAFPEYADTRLRKVVCGPYEVASSGPRIIENFLDMAHFAFVHEGILGEKDRTAIRDYSVEKFDDAEYGDGIRAVNCYAWQPRASSKSTGGADIEYTYRVVRPLTAILTKEPQGGDEIREAISLHLQPLTETITRAWIILALPNFEQSEQELRDFQDTIFMQDKPIVENQRPQRLPLMQGAEVSVACDRMSLAYRNYLRESGLRYGVLPAD
jgi:phenylpropionate dioxygenase-like ring-hydroxylating dioxygenase large terminal subunit